MSVAFLLLYPERSPAVVRFYCIDDESAHVLPDLPRLVAGFVALYFSRPACALVEVAPAEQCRASRAKLFRLTGVLAREPGSFENKWRCRNVGLFALVFPFLLSCSLIPPSGVVDTGTQFGPLSELFRAAGSWLFL